MQVVEEDVDLMYKPSGIYKDIDRKSYSFYYQTISPVSLDLFSQYISKVGNEFTKYIVRNILQADNKNAYAYNEMALTQLSLKT